MSRIPQYEYEGGPIYERINLLSARNIMPHEVRPGDNFGLKIIARVWESWNGWCAYQGPTTWTDEQVAFFGDEVDYEVAKLLFPTMAIGRSYGGT